MSSEQSFAGIKEKAIHKEEIFQMPSCACGSCETGKNEVFANKGAHEGHTHDDHSHEEIGNLKIYFLRLALSFAILLLLWFTDYFENYALYIYLFAYVLAGAEILSTALQNLTKGKLFDENFLMAIASVGAFLVGEYSEAVAVLIFYGIGEFMQSMAVAKSKRNIEELMDIKPDTANIKKGNTFQVVKPEDVCVGDIIIVRPGERIPLDGEVLLGTSFLDTRALTGESFPRKVQKNDSVLSGSINKDSVLEIVVRKSYGESTVAKILKLVQHASAKKAKSEKFITKFARYYTPIVVVAALFIAFLPPLFGFGTVGEWVYKALSFLIISCPCALVLSIPISFFGGIGGAAKNGILVKGGNYLESLYSVDTLILDKTGTITKGNFKVNEIGIAENAQITKEELLELAAICEANSTHPIAQSIVAKYSKEINVKAETQEISGKGIRAKINGDTIHLGNAALLEELGIKELEKFNQTVVYIAKNTNYIGYILISDEIKESSYDAIKEIKKSGVQSLIMLTGDTKEIALEVAEKVGISDVRSELLPQDKVAELENIMLKNQKDKRTAFVGDGINDAPVLTRADIGFAMGGVGSDAAIEAADIVIMNDDLTKIATAMKIAKKTRAIVIQNIILALGVKGAIMILALAGITSIWFAIFADVGVAIMAILNAMRAMMVK